MKCFDLYDLVLIPTQFSCLNLYFRIAIFLKYIYAINQYMHIHM